MKLCIDCNTREGTESGGRCPTCRTRYRVSNYRKNGTCTRCGKERYSGTYCKRCLEQSRTKGSKRLLDSRCYSCGGNNPITVDTYSKCLTCWAKQRAESTLKDRNLYQIVIDKLNEQNYKCAYTGEQLVLGRNASVDHIVPTSQGGTHDKSNIQMVCTLVNKMKNNSSHGYFIALCKQITTYSTS